MAQRIALARWFVLVLFGIPAFLIGFGVEGVYQQILTEARAEDMGMAIDGEFARGFFSSSAETRLASEDDPSDFVRITHRIKHGPLLLGGERGLAFGLSAIESRIDADDDQFSELIEALHGRPLVRADTHVGFGGALSMLIHSPTLESEDGQLSFEGARGDIVFEPSSSAARGQLHAGALRLGDDSGEVSVDGLSIRFDTAEPESDGTADVNGSVELGQMRFGTTGIGATVAPTTSTFEASGTGEQGRGTSTTRLGEVRLQGEEGAESVLSGLVLVQTQENRGVDGRSLMDLESKLTFDAFSTGGRTYHDGVLDLALSNFDADAWQALGDAGGDEPRTEEERMEAQMRVMTELLPAALAASPRFEIRQLGLESDAGDVKGVMLLGVDASDPSMLTNPLMLLSKIRAEAKLAAPEQVMHALVDAYLSRDREGDPFDVRARVVAERSALLAKLVADGTLIHEGGRYSIDARLQEGFPIFNGMPADPSFLQGIVPGF